MKELKRKRKLTKTPVPAPPQPELNEAARAQLGNDEEKRRYRPPEDDASIEDPLKDWPD